MKQELPITEDLRDIVNILNEEDAQTILSLKDELIDNWHKRQIFRTETEMRVSVLNDANQKIGEAYLELTGYTSPMKL